MHDHPKGAGEAPSTSTWDELRGRVGLSRQGTAERAGLHRTEVALIEAGKRVPRLDTIVKLAGVVEVEPCALLMGMARELDPPKEGSRN